MGNVRPLSARQWARAAPHIAAVSELGVRFCHAWGASRLTPYIQKRFALEAACLAAVEDELEFRHDDVWGKLFAAMPKGRRYSLDAGATMMVAQYYEKWAVFSFASMTIDRRRKSPNEAPALLAAEAAYGWAAKGRAAVDAPAAAAASLVEQGIWPEGGPLPWWALPRERSDGDWLIGALTRLRKALERACALLARADAFERAWAAKLAGTVRGDAGALDALVIAAGSPALTQGDVTSTLGLSRKAAQKAIAALEEAGAVVEITGRADWRVWLANDRGLSPPLQIIEAAPSEHGDNEHSVSAAKPLKMSRPDPVDHEARDQEIKDAMAECDAASRKLRRLATGHQ